MESHYNDIHSDMKVPCQICGELFDRVNQMRHHVAINHGIMWKFPYHGCKELRPSLESLNYHIDEPESNGGHGGKR